MNETFKYSGRNSFNLDLSDRLQRKVFADPPEHAPFPCRIYDRDGNLKYELSTEQLLDRNFRKYLEGFLKSKSQGKRERGH